MADSENGRRSPGRRTAAWPHLPHCCCAGNRRGFSVDADYEPSHCGALVHLAECPVSRACAPRDSIAGLVHVACPWKHCGSDSVPRSNGAVRPLVSWYRYQPVPDDRALSFHLVGGGLVAAHAGVSAGRDVIPSSRHSDVLRVVLLGVPRQGARRARLPLSWVSPRQSRPAPGRSIFPLMPTSGGGRLLGRNRKLKQGSMWLARRGPEPSPMSLNDRARDRQAHTHSLRLGRVEGFKEAWEALRRQPRPGIPYPDAHAFRLVGFRTDLQFAPAVTVAAHRLDGVDDQVDQHLLDLHPIAPKERQGLDELRLDRGAGPNDFTPSENDRVADRFIDVEPIHLRRRFFYVISDPVDDVSGPIGFGHDTVERFPGFAQIRRLHLQKILSRAGVIARRRDRLDDLMGDR